MKIFPCFTKSLAGQKLTTFSEYSLWSYASHTNLFMKTRHNLILYYVGPISYSINYHLKEMLEIVITSLFNTNCLNCPVSWASTRLLCIWGWRSMFNWSQGLNSTSSLFLVDCSPISLKIYSLYFYSIYIIIYSIRSYCQPFFNIS